MRTNIEIDNDLLTEAIKALDGKPTKRKTLEEALKLLATLHKQVFVRTFRGRLGWSGRLARSRLE